MLRAPRRHQAPAVVRYWHLASLDAPTVAVVWSLAFAWAARVRMAAWVLPLDALVVWTVYVGDRLLDSRRGLECDGDGMHDRHWFHWRHRRVLAPMALAAALAATCIALRWMPAAVWWRDSTIGIASIIYFARVHGGRVRARMFSKELLVGALFTLGCSLPVASLSLAAPIAFFAALAWLNCWAIERWEAVEPRAIVGRIATCIALAGIAGAGSMFASAPRAALLLLSGAASAVLLSSLDQLRGYISTVTLRSLADLALLTPTIVLAAAWLAR